MDGLIDSNVGRDRQNQQRERERERERETLVRDTNDINGERKTQKHINGERRSLPN